jgi:alpha-glucoside transport system substrate-binding protein
MIGRDPPGCWLYRQPSYGAGSLPDGAPGKTTDVFPMPAIDPRFQDAVVGGGSMVAAFSDRPEVREVMRFLLSPEFGVEWAKRGTGFLSPNRRFDLTNYPAFWRTPARMIDAALAGDMLRLDGSDLMPQDVGGDLFWGSMMTYLDQGPSSLDRILARLDAAWPDQG